MTETLHGLFQAQAHATPTATALIEGDRRITYDALERRANRIAHHLVAHGIRPGDTVATALPRRSDFPATLLAIAKVGAAYLPLDPDLPPERLRTLATAARVALTVTDAATAPRLPGPTLMLDQAGLDAHPDTPPAIHTPPDAILTITFTSGSTGRPKGSLIPHRAIPGFFRDNPLIPAGPGQTWLQHSSILWDALTLELWPALLSGGAVALMPELRPTLDTLADALVDHQVTALWLGASLFNALVDEAADSLASVRVCLVGGEALSLPHIRRAQALLPDLALVNGYGPSECTVFATCHPIPRPLPETARTIPIGRPVGDRAVHLLDAAGQRVPVGVPGEICIGGPATALGYLDEPRLTAAAFTPDPFGPPGARLYRTGDFARWQAAGTLEFIGRRDNQVKLRGFRIETGEIEARIRAHPAIRDAACILKSDDGADRLIAYIVPNKSHSETTAQVENWERVFQERVYTASTAADPRFDITGWTSSFDGTPIPEPDMRAWARDIVDQVRALSPRSVLEIGCGSGMLLHQLAPAMDSYTGTDISAAALDSIRALTPGLPHLTLRHQPAHDWTGLDDASFDVVLLSSVVQYFPSVDYLVDVLAGARRVLRPGGSILLADLRSLPLARCLETAIATSQGIPPARVDQRLLQSAELLLDPTLFAALGAVLPDFPTIRTRVQRGRAINELTSYRYHVLLTAAPPTPGPEPTQLANPTLAALEAELARHPARLLATDIPNARLARDHRTLTGADLPPALHPEDLHDLAARLGYQAEIGPSERDPFRLDASFAAPGQTPAPLPIARPRAPRATWSSWANQPHQAASPQALIPELRRALADALPDYMVPAAFVLLDRIPLTANGKLDRRALPEPAGDRAALAASHVPPRTALETVLAGFYEELLHIERVGIHDGFFDLGGHSLLVTQLASRIRRAFRIDLPLRTLFERPTIAALAEAVAAAGAHPDQAERIAALTLKVAAMTPTEIAAMRERMDAPLTGAK